MEVDSRLSQRVFSKQIEREKKACVNSLRRRRRKNWRKLTTLAFFHCLRSKAYTQKKLGFIFRRVALSSLHFFPMEQQKGASFFIHEKDENLKVLN